MSGAQCSLDLPGHNLQQGQRNNGEEVMHLERSQLVIETSRPVSQAALSAHATAGLWALRAAAIVVSLMVVYTFIDLTH